jgi:SAM-dependent methyltransferase
MDEAYWTKRYQDNHTGWNIGYASTPLVHFINTAIDKNSTILIPGAGSGFEAEHLFKKGFRNVDVLDISPEPLAQFSNRNPEFPKKQLFQADFFSFQGQYDFILEQTFFCALEPNLREQYAKKMQSLLKPNGKLAGLLFNFPLTDIGPPYGGSIESYNRIFNTWSRFDIAPCYNSIPPRNNKELFFIASK